MRIFQLALGTERFGFVVEFTGCGGGVEVVVNMAYVNSVSKYDSMGIISPSRIKQLKQFANSPLMS